MKQRATILSILIMTAILCGALARAQTDGRVLGEVTTIDTTTRQITVKLAGGKSAKVVYDEKTLFRRVPPGETTLDKAIAINPGEIGPGDRIIARGSVSDDSVMARSLVVVSQADIEQKRQREREEWKHRSVAGIATTVNAATKEITIRRSSPAAGSLIISAGTGVRFRRYAPDSIRFSDAVDSSFEALKAGDQLCVLGTMNPDGTRFTAEEIVSAAFRMIGGRITLINAEAGEIVITDIQTQQPIKIVVNKASMMRRLTPELLKLLEDQATGAWRAADDSTAGSVQERIENLPPLDMAALKPGDGILVSSIKGKDPARATAVMLATGVESYLKKMAARPGFTLNLVLPGAF